MPQEKQNFWKYLFLGSPHDARKEKVLYYVVHRIKAGVHLGEAVEEEYVRRNASREEVNELICAPSSCAQPGNTWSPRSSSKGSGHHRDSLVVLRAGAK
jgi:hypothetical protein